MLKNVLRQKAAAKSFVRTHFVSIKDLDKSKIEKLLKDAAQLKKQVQQEGKLDICRGKVVGLLFCEQSTRTTSSFNVAALKLGADVLPLDYNNSSSKKGETLEDTLRVFENYCDTIVMRHPQAGIFQKMIPFVKKPLVNAGDGVGEHPTQAMLDLFTMTEELGTVDGKTVTLMGDLKHGRTVHSLMYLLKNFNNVTVNLVAPSHLAFPEEILNELKATSLKINHSADLTQQIVASSDILYVTRLQRERFLDEKDFFKVSSGYTVNEKTIAEMKPSARILHPLPRVDELSPAIDSDERAVYLTKQVANGVFMRMSILASVLGKI